MLVANEDAEHQAELTSLLDEAGYSTVGVRSGDDALALALSKPPSLVILDVALADKSGYEVCRALREEFGDGLPIVFVSGTRTESHDRVAGLLVGADDYVVKPYAPDELLARVRRLTSRARPHGDAQRTAPGAPRLTPRELEVLRLMADGRSPNEIAAQLFISPQTVRTHIEHILGKLGVNSRVQAVAVAYRDGLLDV